MQDKKVSPLKSSYIAKNSCTFTFFYGWVYAKMAVLEKNKWLSSDTYQFERDDQGNFFAVKSEPGSKIKVVREQLPDGSFTKFMRDKVQEIMSQLLI